jgi:hypothetical protein
MRTMKQHVEVRSRKPNGDGASVSDGYSQTGAEANVATESITPVTRIREPGPIQKTEVEGLRQVRAEALKESEAQRKKALEDAEKLATPDAGSE